MKIMHKKLFKAKQTSLLVTTTSSTNLVNKTRLASYILALHFQIFLSTDKQDKSKNKMLIPTLTLICK